MTQPFLRLLVYLYNVVQKVYTLETVGYHKEESMDENAQQTDTTTSKPGGMSPMIIVGVIAVLVLVGGFALFSGKSQTADTAPTPESATNTLGSESLTQPEESATSLEGTSATPDTAMGEEQTIEMEAGAFYYSVKEIRVKKGETVTIHMTAKDMMHDFTIDELGVKSETIKTGESTTFTFAPDQVGEFEYYCAIGQHRKNGQVGKIIVTE